MRLVAMLNHQATTFPVRGLRYSIEIELASEIALDTRASLDLSLRMAEQLLAARQSKPEYTG